MTKTHVSIGQESIDSFNPYPVICYVWENGHVELGEDGPDGEYLYGTVMDVDCAADLDKIIQLQTDFENPLTQPIKE